MPFEKITHAQIKHLRSLQLKKYRQKYNQFIVEGRKSVLEFLESPLNCLGIYGLENALNEMHDPRIENLGVLTNAKQMSQVSALKHASGLLACFEIPAAKPVNDKVPLILALDDIRDPGNLGTIIRTADWFGLDQLICSSSSVDCYNSKVIQSSMGSLSRVNVHYRNLPETLSQLKDYEIMVADMHGEPYQHVQRDRVILVIGNEGHGVSEEINALAHRTMSIPRKGKTESLNAAVSAAILLAAWT